MLQHFTFLWFDWRRVRLEAKLTEMMCVFTVSSRVTPSSSLHFSTQSVSRYHNLTVQKLSVLRILEALYNYFAPSIIFIQQKLLVLSDVEVWCPLGLRAVISKVWSLKPTATSLEMLLEMQIPVSHSRTNETEPRGLGPRSLCPYTLSVWSWGAQVWELTALKEIPSEC